VTLLPSQGVTLVPAAWPADAVTPVTKMIKPASNDRATSDARIVAPFDFSSPEEFGQAVSLIVP
jgi:hypothetical protein